MPTTKFNTYNSIPDIGDELRNEAEKAELQQPIRASCIPVHWKISGLTILGGEPEIGKTWLAIQVALEQLEREIPVLFFSFEMSRRQLLGRFLDMYENRQGNNGMPKKPTAKIQRILEIETFKNLYVVDSSDFFNTSGKETEMLYTPLDYGQLQEELTQFIETQKNTKAPHVPVVLIDSMHEIPTPPQYDKELKIIIDYNMARLRNIVNNTETHIIAIAQNNRESNKKKKDEEPTLYDFSGSAKIEFTVDTAMALYEKGETLQLKLLKSRNAHIPKNQRIEQLRRNSLLFQLAAKGYSITEDNKPEIL